mgnify:CR=1 FL=1
MKLGMVRARLAMSAQTPAITTQQSAKRPLKQHAQVVRRAVTHARLQLKVMQARQTTHTATPILWQERVQAVILGNAPFAGHVTQIQQMARLWNTMNKLASLYQMQNAKTSTSLSQGIAATEKFVGVTQKRRNLHVFRVVCQTVFHTVVLTCILLTDRELCIIISKVAPSNV